MNIDLSGKTALVTGSTSGIGYAIAKGLAASGADVVINGRSQDSVNASVRKLEGVGGSIRGIAADVSTAAGCEALVTALPQVDILVNNAGIFQAKDFFDIPDQDWTRFFEVNVMSGVRLSRAYLEGMIKRNWGRIVFISSEVGTKHPDRNDPLRHDQDRTTRNRTRACATRSRHQRHRQLRTARTDHVGRRRGVCEGSRQAEWPVDGRGGGKLRQAASPNLASAALRKRR